MLLIFPPNLFLQKYLAYVDRRAAAQHERLGKYGAGKRQDPVSVTGELKGLVAYLDRTGVAGAVVQHNARAGLYRHVARTGLAILVELDAPVRVFNDQVGIRPGGSRDSGRLRPGNRSPGRSRRRRYGRSRTSQNRPVPRSFSETEDGDENDQYTDNPQKLRIHREIAAEGTLAPYTVWLQSPFIVYQSSEPTKQNC